MSYNVMACPPFNDFFCTFHPDLGRLGPGLRGRLGDVGRDRGSGASHCPGGSRGALNGGATMAVARGCGGNVPRWVFSNGKTIRSSKIKKWGLDGFEVQVPKEA